MNKAIATTVAALATAGSVAYLALNSAPPPPPPGPTILSAVFAPAEPNASAAMYVYPLIWTNTSGQIFTNRTANYSTATNVTLEWESVAGHIYVVECSPFAADETPSFLTNGATVRTNGFYGEGWTPRSLPVQATGAVCRSTVGVWGGALEQRFYRIKEL